MGTTDAMRDAILPPRLNRSPAPRKLEHANADARWSKLLHDTFQHFKYQNIMTEDVVQYVNTQLGRDLTPIFDQYLRRSQIPTLELTFNEAEGTLAYRWKADERAFAMPIRAGARGQWQTLEATTDWKVMKNTIKPDDFEVATDLFYVNVAKQAIPAPPEAKPTDTKAPDTRQRTKQ